MKVIVALIFLAPMVAIFFSPFPLAFNVGVSVTLAASLVVVLRNE